jgi:BolA protein
MLRDLIETRLREALRPKQLEVLDESAAHADHAGSGPGGQSHFRVRIVSTRFAGLTRLERHRLVNAILAGAFERGLHALAIEASCPGEATRRSVSSAQSNR